MSEPEHFRDGPDFSIGKISSISRSWDTTNLTYWKIRSVAKMLRFRHSHVRVRVSGFLYKNSPCDCWHILLSRFPKEQVSSGCNACTALFGMGRGGSRCNKTPANTKAISSRHVVKLDFVFLRTVEFLLRGFSTLMIGLNWCACAHRYIACSEHTYDLLVSLG